MSRLRAFSGFLVLQSIVQLSVAVVGALHAPQVAADPIMPPANWLPQVRVTASFVNAATEFGNRVAVSGDVMVVGVYSDDSATLVPSYDASANASGAAWVIRAPGGDWSHYVVDLYLKEPPATGGPARGHLFGSAVAIDGRRIAVSMTPRTANAPGGKPVAERVFVYYNAGVDPSIWSGVSATMPADTIVDPKFDAKDKNIEGFGMTLALSGHNLFVGDPYDDGKDETAGSQATPLVTNSGAVNVYYDMSDNGTGYQASVPMLKLKQRKTGGTIATPTASAAFGSSLAFSGKSLVVAPSATVNRVTVYTSTLDNFAAGSITVKQLEPLVNPESGDHFGTSVAIHGSTVVVGAPEEDSDSETVDNNLTTDSGAAYVFNSPGGNADWSGATLVARLKQRTDSGVPNSVAAIHASNHFGSTVAVDGRLIAVSALGSSPIDGQAGAGQGKVIVFQNVDVDGIWNDASEISWHSNLSAPEADTQLFDQFGYVLQLDSSTGTFRCIVAAPYDDTEGKNSAGSVYVYQGNP